VNIALSALSVVCGLQLGILFAVLKVSAQERQHLTNILAAKQVGDVALLERAQNFQATVPPPKPRKHAPVSGLSKEEAEALPKMPMGL
jgi:hypothetical protein|tara:strand:+ start:262 stop:525 length:264 start_codon:yes stop_codon:yes gene_type:complete